VEPELLRPTEYIAGMRTHTMVRGAVLGAVAVFALGAGACGSSGSSSASPGPAVTVGNGACGVTVTTTLSVKPQIKIPACAVKPPSIKITDIVTGTGPQITQGQDVTVKYVGIGWSTRKQFDASWDRNTTFTVQNLGQANVVMGWNIGLVGSRVGGRRLLEIPPDMGYGPDANGSIPANETLVFVVDIVSAKATGQ
jgi:peptidylprolyl isomerase